MAASHLLPRRYDLMDSITVRPSHRRPDVLRNLLIPVLLLVARHADGLPFRQCDGKAAFNISFGPAQLGVLFFSSFIRARSSVVIPGRCPASVSARRAQIRSVSWLIDRLAAIDSIAANRDEYSPWWSETIRTARSRTPGGYGDRGFLFRSDIAPSSQRQEQLPIPGRFTDGLRDFQEADQGYGQPGSSQWLGHR
jgi:hypothetical protein